MQQQFNRLLKILINLGQYAIFLGVSIILLIASASTLLALNKSVRDIYSVADEINTFSTLQINLLNLELIEAGTLGQLLAYTPFEAPDEFNKWVKEGTDCGEDDCTAFMLQEWIAEFSDNRPISEEPPVEKVVDDVVLRVYQMVQKCCYWAPNTGETTSNNSSTNLENNAALKEYDWSGEWTIWVGPEPLSEHSSTLSSISSGSYSSSLLNGTLTAAALPDTPRALNGSITSDSQSYTIKWFMRTNKDQFSGVYVDEEGSTHPICGARNGLSQPTPCLGTRLEGN